ncbi:hypothetical protein V493_01823 [Pseudogymnoascus sp. VKM F-4281 (FW-2241)]|nr:hypothetical protein V493_01823 [Pseudogymnoascus sp. VKM F-4281 (FW-2241)]
MATRRASVAAYPREARPRPPAKRGLEKRVSRGRKEEPGAAAAAGAATVVVAPVVAAVPPPGGIGGVAVVISFVVKPSRVGRVHINFWEAGLVPGALHMEVSRLAERSGAESICA